MSLSGPSSSQDTEAREQERSHSPVLSCVSAKSDRSMDLPSNFRQNSLGPQSGGQQQISAQNMEQERSHSPVLSCVSAKSDRSMDLPSNFKQNSLAPQSGGQQQTSAQNMEQERSHSPVLSCVSAKSDRSMDLPSNFRQNSLAPQSGGQQQISAQSINTHELEDHEDLKMLLKRKFEYVNEGQAESGCLLSDIYTELYVTEGMGGDVNTEHEIRQIEMPSKRSTLTDTPVHCSDIFRLTSKTDAHVRTVLTRGIAGIGKTITVQKFIVDWAEGRANQDVHLLLPLPFRELNLLMESKHSLVNLVEHFTTQKSALQLCNADKCKIIFIFDGLDECRPPLRFCENSAVCDVTEACSVDTLLTSLMKGALLPSALLWVTSRPGAANKIPPEYVHLLTEIRGFSDAQKEQYFRKKISEPNLCREVVSHVKASRSLYIMCHIPVFCWISAIVLQRILSDANAREIPKTLTEMYTHFLITQSNTRNEKYAVASGLLDREMVLKLGKLAFQQLETGNLIFYERHLADCGIDAEEASVYSGVCTQIFREAPLHHGKVYCFVHLSIQEFLAALFLFVSFASRGSHDADQCVRHLCDVENFSDLERHIVDEAQQSESGHLDLFLRFLLGLSLEATQGLLQCLIPQLSTCRLASGDQTVRYIKQKIRKNAGTEKTINLFHCLRELKDPSLEKEIQSYLSTGCLSRVCLSPAQWSALVFVLLTSEEGELKEFDLKKYARSEKCLLSLLPCVKASRTSLLNKCNLTEECCPALASVLCSTTSCLRRLDLSGNKLYDLGVEQLCSGLQDPHCKLERLRLLSCGLTEEAFSLLASALSTNPCHLRLLDLGENQSGESGIKRLCSVLVEELQCVLEILMIAKCAVTEKDCMCLATVLGSDTSRLKVLDLSRNEPKDTGVKLLSDALQHSKLQSLKLRDCDLTERSCEALAMALSSEMCSLTELDLKGNDLGDSGIKQMCSAVMTLQCKLSLLCLSDCGITEVGICALASALRSNPSHLRDLDLSYNDPGDTGLEKLSLFLQEPGCRLAKLNLLDCDLTEESCSALASALTSDSSALRELDLSRNPLGDSGATELSGALAHPHCHLEKLRLVGCEIGEEGGTSLALALGSNGSRLRSLVLSKNRLGDAVMYPLSTALRNPVCELKSLSMSECGITGEGCVPLAEALSSGTSQLKKLDMTGNNLRQEGVRLLSAHRSTLKSLLLSEGSRKYKDIRSLAVALRGGELRELDLSHKELDDSGLELITEAMRTPDCRLETLRLYNNKISSAGCVAMVSALRENPQHLLELDLSGNEPGDDGVELLASALREQHCRLHTLKLNECNLTKSSCAAVASVLKGSHLKELALSHNNLGDSGVKLLSEELQHAICTLEALSLASCGVTHEGCACLASALRSNPGHLQQLDLTGNALGDQGRALLLSLQQDPDCRLDKLSL
ncbi:NACHT, LRR and PYD domains-containing protein 3-like isoform X2 [Alosa pseudoharengus]|uniref:NACHT, LRR and PYD domains-containing protein 3-like isoform X2 n=1 Tax=Alosa pseudoharengus TaxID=34774 RepID=UPI003F8A00B9